MTTDTAVSGVSSQTPVARRASRVAARPDAAGRGPVAVEAVPTSEPLLVAVPMAVSDATTRRAINVILAFLAFIVAVPLMAIVAMLVKLTSRGPIFYTQVRVGLDRRTPESAEMNHRRLQDIGGKPFDIYKFRTMYADAEQRTGAVWATEGDPRITPVGRFLRQYRLDELPQLINVMRGEMNIVGPRPERPTIFAELRENIAEYPLRQRAKPGITGLAQINHHYDACLDDVRTKVRYDLEYIGRQGVVEDFVIMLKTVPVILFRKGGW